MENNYYYIFRLACDNLQTNEFGLYDEISMVKDYMGPDPPLEEDLEERLRMYIRESTIIGIPRNQQRFLLDIDVYLKTYGIILPRFCNGKPGIWYMQMQLYKIEL